jgi:hypothetical protein
VESEEYMRKQGDEKVIDEINSIKSEIKVIEVRLNEVE